MKQLFSYSFTPLFNTPSFVHDMIVPHETLRNPTMLYRPLECALFRGEPVTVVGKEGQCAEVKAPTYAEGTFYTDIRLLSNAPEQRVHPSKKDVTHRLLECLGLPYVWGGNDPSGMKTFSRLYSFKEPYFRGVDCSGLLYYAFRGLIPRNTSQLLSFGETIALHDIQPLDICVWKGHVICFLSSDTIIESREHHGVVNTPAKKRLAEMRESGLFDTAPSEGGVIFRRIFETSFERFFKTL